METNKKGAGMAVGNAMDVSKKTAAPSARKTIPENAEVLPTLSSQCECELVVNETGQAMVIYTKQLSEGIEWAEYDIDLAMLTFVTWTGKVMGLGMKIHTPLREPLSKAREVMLVETEEDKITIREMYPIELVTRYIGI